MAKGRIRAGVWALLPLLALLLPLNQAGAEVRVVDDRGLEVVLARPANRIVPLYGALADILLALDAGEAVLARTDADTAPELADRLSIGTHMRPNVELLAGLRPDLVLQMGGRKDASLPLLALERLGVSTAFFEARDFEELFSVIQRIAVLCGREARARELERSMRVTLDKARGLAGELPRRRVFYEVRYPNLLAAGQGSMVDALIRAAGGRNCLEGGERLVRLNEEELLRLDPEVCLTQQGPMNPAPVPFVERVHFRTLSCVRSGQTFVVDEKRFSRPGPQSADAALELARLLFGGR